MSLTLYLRNRWVRRHRPSRDEVTRLLAIADRDLEQSQTPGLVPEWRFDIAYNAALQLATAALAAAGYQAERQNKHMRTLECLEFVVNIDQDTVSFLDRCRRKRHAAVYDRVGAISEHEADEMLAAATRLRAQIGSWLQQEHPDLVD
jgi:uncharacterized protein (UPF0332 family)